MRNIPVITKNLLIINAIVFIATYIIERAGIDFTSIFGLHFFLAEDFHIYQFVTYQFLHGGFTHIFFNMFALWMFGCVIENVWGPKKFLFYYISCGVGAGVLQELAQLCSFYFTVSAQDPSIGMLDIFAVGDALSRQLNSWTTIGASGAVYAILLAFGMTFPNERIFIFPLPIPVKAKWFVMFYAGIEFFSAMSGPGDNVAHMAHLGGMLFGYLMIRYWNKNPHSGGFGERNNIFGNLKDGFGRQKKNFFSGFGNGRPSSGNDGDVSGRQRFSREDDWEYNERMKARQVETDRILDKIRKSGYDSLTESEKRFLFESGDK
ncbi:rhomboid family intramembrane serine protease [Xylanibacter muris]|uniref:Rhomboid family intramembrane serine protease n=1 Tax=Xylanibacter muris TaxID=2736290 RepID=A0ABX2AJ08_9BACT|nr:rhomboid family intramembrane serine protease [Xylanibacter muris]NPD91073.1 rhomboid family intramembrane serine protease [Xylanibacter muris]